MRTRSGFDYTTHKNDCVAKRRRDVFAGDLKFSRKRRKFCFGGGRTELLEALPDDVVIFILCKLSSSASCPADYMNALTTCKKLNTLGRYSLVLSKASRKMIAVKANNWSESAHRFLKLCVDSGNVEAFYTLGMIHFYCLQHRSSGATLMAKAAIDSHAQALYSLSVIHFNGSGGSKHDKDLRAGVALCARAAVLGHMDALRELGHCLQDGYGVKQDVREGRRFILQANALELAAADSMNIHRHTLQRVFGGFGCNTRPVLEAHPVNRFLTEWFADKGSRLVPGYRLCANSGCGRVETRRHEFRRCSVCGVVNYCSRACQSLDWKIRHKIDCTPVDMRENEAIGDGDGDVEVT